MIFFLNRSAISYVISFIYREKKHASLGAWKVLSFGVASLERGQAADGERESEAAQEITVTAQICQRFVDKGGIKYLFANLLGKVSVYYQGVPTARCLITRANP